MILNKTKYILILVGLFILTGCTNNFEETDLKETNTEIMLTSLSNSEGLQEDSQIEIQLLQKEGYYTLKGTNNYLEGLLVTENDGFKLIDQQRKRQISIDFETLTWSEEDSDAIKHYSVEEQKRYGFGIETQLNMEYVVSQDMSKIAIINEAENTIKIYHFNNKKTTVIDSIDISHIKKPYHENIIFSPKAGYISIKMLDEKNGEGFVSFGADSGNKVHDLIYGINPQWNHQENTIAFLYRDLDKVGIYQRRTRKITYLVELEKPELIIGVPFWTKDDAYLYFTTGVEESRSIQIVDLKDRSSIRVTEEVAIENEKPYRINDIYLIDHALVYAHPVEDQISTFKIAALNGTGTTQYLDVDTFQLQIGDDKDLRNFMVIDEGVIYIKDGEVYLIKKASTVRILRNKGEVSRIQFIPEKNLIVFFIEGTDTCQTVFLFLDELF
ncbi:hypothetical protein [Alkaliphilus transvaalensis]|uniref:hypothetical protein n=1 Tax=Alkaliphilus transvaalensis TaxID=114628 RepID=UPI00047C9F31|nr:hypothetical protein [Alkaliphilus transvaalensis]